MHRQDSTEVRRLWLLEEIDVEGRQQRYKVLFSPAYKAVATPTIRLQFDSRSTPTRMYFDRLTTIRRPALRPVLGLLHRSLNEQAVRLGTRYTPAPILPVWAP